MRLRGTRHVTRRYTAAVKKRSCTLAQPLYVSKSGDAAVLIDHREGTHRLLAKGLHGFAHTSEYPPGRCKKLEDSGAFTWHFRQAQPDLPAFDTRWYSLRDI